LTVNGGGKLVLSGANTYTGDTTIAGGIVSITNGNALADSSGITIDSGGELDVTGVTLATPFTSVSGTGATGGGAIVNTGGTSTLSGTMSLSGAATIDVVSGGLTISGAIGGTGSLTAAGGNTLTLTNVNTYSGGTTISAGTTVVASSGSLGSGAVTDDGELDLDNTTLSNDITLDSTGNAIINTSGTSSLNGAITLAADAIIDVAPSSTLTFFGAIGDGSPSNGHGLTETGGGLLITAATTSNTYTGTTTVDSGTFEMDQQWGSRAIQGPLVIGDGTDTAKVLNWQNNQFGPGVAVTLKGANATLDLNGLVDTVASLTFYGGTVSTGAGTLTLGGDVTTEGTSTGSVISGNLALADNVDHVFTVPGGAASGPDLDISAVISGGATAGLTKAGGGTLSLDADSTTGYSGAVTIQRGTLKVTASGALGTGTVEIDDPAAMDLDGTSGDIILANYISLYSASNEIVNLAGSNTLSGGITVGATATIDVESGSTLTISGSIGDGGTGSGVTKVGQGTMVYSASFFNTYAGTTTVALGELDFDSTAAHGAIGGPLQIGTGPGGSATVKYLASNQLSSTTDVTVSNSQATLDLNGHSDSINNLTVTNGLVSLPAGSSLTVAGLTMTGGDINTGTGSTFSLGGNVTINDSPSGSTIDGTGSLSLGASTRTLTVSATTPAVGLNIAIPITGTGGLTMTGGGTMEFSATSANTYTGTTTVDQGTLLLSDSGGEAIAGNLIVGDGTHTALVQEQQFTQTDSSNTNITVNTSATFDFNGYDDYLHSMDVEGGTVTAGGAFVTLGGSLTMTGGSVTTASNGNFRLANNVTINAASTTATIAGVLDLGAATQTFTVAHGTAPSGIDLDVSASIYNGSLIKAGAGTMELDGDNTYTGTTEISAGTLEITAAHALSSNSSGATVDSGATLELSGGFITDAIPLTLNGTGVGGNGALVNASGSNHYAGNITLGSNASIAVNAGSLWLPGVISGTGFGITKLGPNSLLFNGGSSNTYTGATIVDQGTLSLNKLPNLVSIPGDLTIGDGTDTAQVSDVGGGEIASTSNVTIDGSNATLTLSNVNDTIASLTFTGGAVTTGAGTLTLGGSVVTNAAATTATIGGRLDLGGANRGFLVAAGGAPGGVDLDVSAAISGTGAGIVKAGAGTLQLDGVNTFDGGLADVSGTVVVANGAALGSAAATITSGAELDLSGGISVGNDLTIAGAGASGGAAIVGLSGSNALTGAITITADSSVGAANGATLAIDGIVGDGNSGYLLTVANGPTGTTQLDGDNTYAGSTTVLAGYLGVGQSNARGPPAPTRPSRSATRPRWRSPAASRSRRPRPSDSTAPRSLARPRSATSRATTR
jgi:autotransporter-associated beta strand protein